MTTTLSIEHEKFCLPRPGEDAPRIESFTTSTYGEDGVTATGRVRTTRCFECGAARYDQG